VNVARQVAELEPKPRAVALGTFDGVHLGHRRVLDAALAAGSTATVVTFDPHPRAALGYGVELLVPLERRLELLSEAGIEETLVVDFDLELAQLSPEAFAERVLRPLGTEVVLAGSNFRFGRGRAGDLALLERLGFDARPVPLVDGVSSTRIRDLVRSGEVERAAKLLGRPPELAGTVVAGDARGGTLGFPTANLSVDPELLVPAHGIYAGFAGGLAADFGAAFALDVGRVGVRERGEDEDGDEDEDEDEDGSSDGISDGAHGFVRDYCLALAPAALRGC